MLAHYGNDWGDPLCGGWAGIVVGDIQLVNCRDCLRILAPPQSRPTPVSVLCFNNGWGQALCRRNNATIVSEGPRVTCRDCLVRM